MAYLGDASGPTQQQLLLASILAGSPVQGAPPASMAVKPTPASDDDEEDTSAAPPPSSPAQNPLAQSLYGGVSMPPAARQVPLAAALAPSPQAAPSSPAGAHYAQLPGPPLLLQGEGAQQPRGTPVAGATPSPSTAPAAAGSVGGQPAPEEDATTAAYRAQHDSSVATYNRALAMAQQTAGTPASAVYLKIAEDAAKAANDVNLKAIEYNSGLARAPNAQESAFLTAAGENPLHYQSTKGKLSLIDQEDEDSRLAKAEDVPPGVDPNTLQVGPGHKLEAIPGTENTEIQTWKAVNADRATRGEPPIPLNDFHLEKSLYGKGDRPLTDASGKEIDSSVTGDELLKALPPAVANHAQAIAEIREKWPSGTEQARQPQLQQALAAAQQLDPSLNQQTFATRQSMKNAAESGSGRINVANLANNTALFHSSTLADAITALNNSNNTVLNAAINSGAGPTGGIIPGATNKADEVKQFNVARDAVANELERSFHGVGTTAEQAVKRQIDDLSVNDAPQTQLGALKAAQDLLRGKIEANEADYRDTMGDKNVAAWERDHGRKFGFITPAAQSAGDRVAAMYQSVKAGKGFHGFVTPQPQVQVQGGETAPSAPRNVAPDVTGAPPRNGVYVPGKGIQWQ